MKYFVSVSVITVTFCLFLPSAFGLIVECPDNLPDKCKCDTDAFSCTADNATITISTGDSFIPLLKVLCSGVSDENISILKYHQYLDFEISSIRFESQFYDNIDLEIESCPMSVVMLFNDLGTISTVQMKVTTFQTLPANYLNYQNSSNLMGLELIESKHLEILPANIFENFTNLEQLTIVDTNITTLPKSIFKNLINLKSLDLRRNNLTSLDESIFDGLVHLSLLNLIDNHLKTLPANIFTGLRLDILELKNNPWQCDRDFLKMFKSQYVIGDFNEIVCPDGGRPSVQLICPSECECVMDEDRGKIVVNSSTSDMNRLFSELILPKSIWDFHLIVENRSLQSLPNNEMEGYGSVTRIFAANNSIKNITVDNLPSGLTEIDLRGNKLETLSAPVVNLLKDVSNVWLANNNAWKCDDVFLDFIKFNQEKIDSEFIYCNDDEPIVAKLNRYKYWITNNMHERIEPHWTNEIVRRINSNTDETGQICPSECDCVISAKNTIITYRCSFVDLTRITAHFDSPIVREHWPNIKDRFVKF